MSGNKRGFPPNEQTLPVWRAPSANWVTGLIICVIQSMIYNRPSLNPFSYLGTVTTVAWQEGHFEDTDSVSPCLQKNKQYFQTADKTIAEMTVFPFEWCYVTKNVFSPLGLSHFKKHDRLFHILASLFSKQQLHSLPSNCHHFWRDYFSALGTSGLFFVCFWAFFCGFESITGVFISSNT